jgi:hypothetical protein
MKWKIKVMFETTNQTMVDSTTPQHKQDTSPTAPTSLPVGFFCASRQHLQQLSIVIFHNLDGSIQIERRQPTEECLKITCLPG